MKTKYIVLLLLLCHVLVSAQTSVISGVSGANIRNVLYDLSADDMQGREAGTSGIERAAAYLEKYLMNCNIPAFFTSYRDTIATYDKITSNIVGYIPGNDSILKKEFILLSAHYDHVGMEEGSGDVIYNGANDDASGVAVVADLARVLAKEKKNARSYLIVFFTAEEKGLLGSSHLAAKLKRSGIELYTMLNFEMVGVPMKRDYLAYVSGYERSNMADVVNNIAGKKLLGFLPEEIQYKLFMRSDNFPFYKSFSIPAHTVCTFDFGNYEYYHHVDDEAGNMDIAHMTALASDILPVLQHIANAPSREIQLHD